MSTPEGSRTELTRERHRQVENRDRLDALLDSVHIGHVASIAPDGSPLVIPTAVVRDGDLLLLHGSTGSPWMSRAAAGAPIAVAVTAFDGLVFARSAFESSIHYRSAVLFGAVHAITDQAGKLRALDLFTDALMPGRVAEVRRPRAKELAATQVLALPITEWSLKMSADWPQDGPDDVAGTSWAGVVDARIVYGPAHPAPDLPPGIELAPSAQALSAPPPGPPG